MAFQVGKHRHVLRVSGDRYWGARTGRWVATEPEPFTEMPLAWARALGGEGYGPNPVGKGLSEAVGLDGVLRRPLPNVEDPAALVTSPDDRPEPAGLGPLSPLWAQRRAKLGTYGDDYVERHWPWFPEDFDWAYFNAAPAALQVEGYLRGDEPVVLENLHPEHQRYVSRLPGLRVRCFVTRVGERGEERFDEVEMRLDTLWIDADAERLVLVWRGWTGVADEDFEEVRHAFIVTEPTTEAPRGLDHYRVRLADRLAEEAAGLWGGAGQAARRGCSRSRACRRRPRHCDRQRRRSRIPRGPAPTPGPRRGRPLRPVSPLAVPPPTPTRATARRRSCSRA